MKEHLGSNNNNNNNDNNNNNNNTKSFQPCWRPAHLAPWTPLGLGLGDDIQKKKTVPFAQASVGKKSV